MSRYKLDLSDVNMEGQAVETEIARGFSEAVQRRVTYFEIAFGENNGELKKRVLHCLAQPRFKALYHRVEKDEKSFGRVFVHFRLLSNRKRIHLKGCRP